MIVTFGTLILAITIYVVADQEVESDVQSPEDTNKGKSKFPNTVNLTCVYLMRSDKFS